MVKTLLYISPQFPWNFINFITRLKQHGVAVLGIASDPYDALPEELKSGLAEYYRVDNMLDYNQVLEAACFFQRKYGSIDRVESHTEFWLPFEAALREDLSIWGRKRKDTQTGRHKSLMKDVFRSLNIEVAPGQVAINYSSARDFAAKVGYPVILKPDAGVGAAGTWKVQNEAELQSRFQEHDLSGYFIEAFVQGNIETFDGLTDREGNIIFNSGLIYSTGIMEAVVRDDHIYYWTVQHLPPDLVDAGQRTLKAFDVREKFFHFEFFRRTSDQKLLGLEVNIRPPGAWTVDMWNYADDIDMYDQWARLIVGKPFNAKWSRRYTSVYLARKDSIPYVYDHDAIVAACGSSLVFEARNSPLFRNALGDSGYILRGSNLESLQPLIEKIHQTYR